MGKKPGYRQVTMYADYSLYERVRCAAYTIGEDIFEFVDEALRNALDRRLTPQQRSAVNMMANQNLKNEKPGKHARRQLR